jgi:phosphoribosylanthranilate isomerase
MPPALIIKICGLSTAPTLEAALAAEVDMVGFVFFEKSPRNVSLALADDLGRRVEGRARKVALCVDADDPALAAIIARLQPDLLQLHGTEMPERVAAIRGRFGRPVMKAIGIARTADLAQIGTYAEVADWLLFDAKASRDASTPGGNGRSFDWHLLSGLRVDKPYLLSGGLNAQNVGEALAITQAPGVDVSSGVESAPGIKDPAAIADFVARARQAAAAARPLGSAARTA